MKKTTVTYDDVSIVPSYSNIQSRRDVDLKSRVTKNYDVELPVLASPMDTVCESEMATAMQDRGGLGCVHRSMTIEEQVAEMQTMDRESMTCASIGMNGDYLDRAKKLVNQAGVNIILIDVAHGDHNLMVNAITELKMMFLDVDVIAGNIATAEAAERLCRAGADSLRVGIGSGSLCTTRVKTGVGVPMITCLQNIVPVADSYDVPVIADGGIRETGDMAKALAVGADTVMIGSLLSGTKETPGTIKRSGSWPNEQLYKEYRGSASAEAKRDARGEVRNVEGMATQVKYKGPVKRILKDIRENLQSAFSYVGARNIQEFHNQASLIRVSNSARIEAQPHLLT